MKSREWSSECTQTDLRPDVHEQSFGCKELERVFVVCLFVLFWVIQDWTRQNYSNETGLLKITFWTEHGATVFTEPNPNNRGLAS